MRNVSDLNNLRDYLEKLGYSPNDISEIIASYTAIIPVLATISLRLYKERRELND